MTLMGIKILQHFRPLSGPVLFLTCQYLREIQAVSKSRRSFGPAIQFSKSCHTCAQDLLRLSSQGVDVYFYAKNSG
jgi:hypothetical protein